MSAPHVARSTDLAPAQETVRVALKRVAIGVAVPRHDRTDGPRPLEKLSNLDLVRQIETKVGQELQYTRLNGAIVGGFAGAVPVIIKVLA